MKNYKITLCYDGTRYHGWEKKEKLDTIQGKLEQVLSRMCDTPVEVIGAGRTDAGVHAKAMVASAWMETGNSEDEIREYMNHYLPDDISIEEVKEAGERFHARYKAIGKTYCYTCFIGENKPVFNRKYVYQLDFEPDIEAMKKAAELLTGEHDFMSFCANKKMKKSTVRLVDMIEIKRSRNLLFFTFHGTGFLRHMVRILVGTLLEVGSGKRKPEEMSAILEGRDRALAGPMAPAQGLCLEKVDY